MNTTRQIQTTPSQGLGSMLFGRRKKRGDPLQERIDCLIGAGTTVAGDLIFTGGLRIDGMVQGDVTVSDIKAGTLVIGDGGCIQGDVRVSHVIVYGEIRGTVYATGLVELHSNARITGDIHYDAIEMQAGAQIVGHLVNQTNAGAAQ
jgi:cytoskeletal protein CcmA (bactofilin family)